MVMIKSPDIIYPTLVTELEKATRPQTAPDLMGNPKVFAVCVEKWGTDKTKIGEKLSDTLGFMWRRGVLDRFPAPPSHQMARYAYALAGRTEAVVEEEPIKYDKPSTRNKGAMIVHEKEGEVVIELKEFTIVVKPK